MKSRVSLLQRKLLTAALGGLAVMLAGSLFAQPGGGGRGGRFNQDPAQNPQGGPPDRAAMMGGRGGFGFGLDEQQRQVFNEALQKHQDALRKLEEQLQAAQRELIKAVIAEEYVEKTVREKAEVVAKLQTEIMMLRAQALHTVAPTLREEQRVQMEDSRFSMMLLSGGFGGGPGGGRGMMMGGGPPGMDQGGPGFGPGMGGPGGRDPMQFRGQGGPGGRPDPGQGGPNRDRGNRGDRGNRDGGQAAPGLPVEQRPPR
ncbi:MAG: periplasmic heavy metal sensor [Verrucomicrobiae bacterium]|nr:periplasmic heavy metal sensor [Verrucomicrobiae bacterium]